MTPVRYAIVTGTGVALALIELVGMDIPRELVGADGAAVTLTVLAAGLGWWFPRVAGCVAILAGAVGVGAAAQPLLFPALTGLAGVVVLVWQRVWAIAVVAGAALALAAVSRFPTETPDGSAWVITTLVTAAVAATAVAWRNRREAARAERLLREREIAAERQDAARAERARIARELHDVVAHSVSVIASLAETAPYTLGELDPPVREKFAEIAREARAALGELRDLLSTLRRDDAPGLGLGPVPDLAGIENLVADHRRAGGSVELVQEGDLTAIPVAVGIAAHRIVQEALTNVRRHTDGAHATVTLARRPGSLLVHVRDTGPRRPSENSTGHGLIGMHERAAAVRGRVRAEPVGDGFEVCAELPVDEEPT